jgi:hypothetical protein
MELAERTSGAERGRTRGRRRTWSVVFLTVAAVSLAACGSPAASPEPAATAAPSTGTVIPGDFPLLGSWTTSVTKTDLGAAGITDPNAQNENSGRFTWTFAPDGTWSLVQESLDGSPINTPVFRGTYTVGGVSIVATTTFPEQYRDTGLHYDYALENGGVRFDVIDPPDAFLPVIVETHPWVRAG